MKQILFGLNSSSNRQIEESILNEYKQRHKEGFNYNSEYCLVDIEKELSKNTYEILILREFIEGSINPVSIDYIDRITDKYPNTRIIFIMENEHENNSYIKSLFNLGIYDLIYKEDADIKSIIESIKYPRNKMSAKIYLDLYYDVEQINDRESLEEIPTEELEVILSNLNNSSKENISSTFNEIDRQYNEKQMLFLMTLVSQEIVDILLDANNKNATYYYNKIRNLLSSQENRESEIEKESNTKTVTIKKVEYITAQQTKKKVGVAGVATGCGTTHTAIGIASYLASRKKKVAIVDESNSLISLKAHAKPLKNQNVFKYNNIDFYFTSKDMSSLVNLQNYDYVIYDLGKLKNWNYEKGQLERNGQYEKMFMMDLQILCLNGSIWRWNDINYYRCDSFAEIEPFIENWKLVLNLADTKAKKKIIREIREITVLRQIFESSTYDPFQLDEQSKEFFESILGSIVESSTLKNKENKKLNILGFLEKWMPMVFLCLKTVAKKIN